MNTQEHSLVFKRVKKISKVIYIHEVSRVKLRNVIKVWKQFIKFKKLEKRVKEIKRVHRLVRKVFELIELRKIKVQERKELVSAKAFFSWKMISDVSWAWKNGLIVIHWIPLLYKMLVKSRENITLHFSKNQKIMAKIEQEIYMFGSFGKNAEDVMRIAFKSANRDMWKLISDVKGRNLSDKIVFLRYANLWDFLVFKLAIFFIVFSKCFKILVAPYKDIYECWNMLSEMYPDNIVKNWMDTMGVLASKYPNLRFGEIKTEAICLKLNNMIEDPKIENIYVPCTVCQKKLRLESYMTYVDFVSRCKTCRNDSVSEDFPILILFERLYRILVKLD